MKTTTRTRIAGLLLAAATLTTACGSSTQQAVPIGTADPFPGNTSSSSGGAPTTTTTAPTTSASPADAAGQASAALTRYLDVFNQLVNSGGDPATELSTVASGIEITNSTNDLAATRASGVKYAKGSQLLSFTVGAVNSSVVPATAQIAACVAGGVPLGQANSAPRPAQRGTFYLINPAWPDPSGWRVNDSDLRGEPCSA